MINLLPPSIKEERLYGRRNRNLLGYSLTLAVTAAVTALIMVGSLQFIGASAPQLEEEIAATNLEVGLLEKNIKPVESIAKRLDTVKDISESAISFSTLLPEIGAVLPEGVILNALTLTGGRTDPLQLDIDMASADLGPVLVRNLIDSDLFEAAEIASLTPKGTSDEENAEVTQYNFQASVAASFTGTADAKKKAAAAAAAQAEAAAKAAEEAGSGAE